MCITESVLIWDVDNDGQRGEAENNIVLDGTEKLQKEQRLEARRAYERRWRMCHDVYRATTNVVAVEKGS